MRAAFALILAAIFFAVPAAGGVVDEVVAQVSQARYTSDLSTQLFTHNGNNRGLAGADHDPARNHIQQTLADLSLATTLDPFIYSNSTYYNVVAVQPGRTRPEQVYIVGAHYDSVNCPGADDNASGVAGVLEAARVLSAWPTEATVIYIGFDREEQGLKGSYAYAGAHAANDIRGMISLDMIAYNPTGSNHNKALLYGRTASGTIKQAMAQMVQQYGGIASTDMGQLDASDHAPFESYGKQACLLIEAAVWQNPYYHKTTDSVDTASYIDYDYATRMTAGAVGYLATYAGALRWGDATGDDVVDVRDLGALAFNYNDAGTGWSDGDFDGNGVVDVRDLAILALHYQEGVPPPPADAAMSADSSPVPEPATLAFLAMGVVLVRRRARVPRRALFPAVRTAN